MVTAKHALLTQEFSHIRRCLVDQKDVYRSPNALFFVENMSVFVLSIIDAYNALFIIGVQSSQLLKTPINFHLLAFFFRFPTVKSTR